MRRWIPRLFVPAASAVLALSPAAPARASGASTEVGGTGSATGSITVLDWNIEGGTSNFLGDRWSSLEAAIRSYDPDVVTLQEVNRAAGTTVVHSDGSTSPGIDELAELSKDFPQFADTATEYHQVWARGDGGGAPGRSAGNAILSRYPLAQRYAVHLPNEPGNGHTCPNDVDYDGRSAETGCPVNRSFAGAMTHVNGSDIRFYTSHFSIGTKQGGVGENERAAQTSFVVGKLQSPPITSAFLFTGDLNMPPGDVNRFAWAGIGLDDAWTLSHDNTGSAVATHQDEDGSFGADSRIDYVWSGPGFTVTSTALGQIPTDGSGVPLTDHRPILTTLAVRTPVVTRAAGASSTGSGWATAAVSPDAPGSLRTCDNVPDTHGALGYLVDAGTGDTIAGAHDDHYADGCVSVAVPAVPAGTKLAVRVCRNDAGTAAACVTKPV